MLATSLQKEVAEPKQMLPSFFVSLPSLVIVQKSKITARNVVDNLYSRRKTPQQQFPQAFSATPE
jgi:hypothetical protein